MDEDENVRKFPQWKVEFKILRCKKCGQKIGTDKEIDYMTKRAKGLPEGWFDICNNCR
jgi:hypothetical protein